MHPIESETTLRNSVATPVRSQMNVREGAIVRAIVYACLSTIAAVRCPLEEDLECKQDVPESSCPRLFLAELLLDRRIADLIFHNPEQRQLPASRRARCK